MRTESSDLRGPSPQTSASSDPSAEVEDARAISEFDVRGRAFSKQAAAQKARIRAIQKRIRELKERLDKWNSEYWIYDYDHQTYVASARAALCATGHDQSDWCNTPQIVEEETRTAKQDLEKAQAELEALQREIRSYGYGTKIYDPD